MGPQTDRLQSDPRYETVQKYYGEVLQSTSDLKTDACYTSENLPARVTKILPLINDEIKNKYYGCGSPVPLCIDGLSILDLGCGTGRDCYVMSRLAGPQGFVYGIDMTENQIAVARKYIPEQTAVFDYSKPNVDFIFDYIESLHKHFKKESLDLVTSNCVINLTEDKEVILRQVYEVLKFGGEMFFADIHADRRVPEKISRDPVLRGECLGGALYYQDFERIARKVGFADPRVFSKRIVRINNEDIQDFVGNINFWSITYRLWKIRDLEDACEDYGHTAAYTGHIPESPFKFKLDAGHVFYKNKPERVCGNTALMLSQTRFKKYFEVSGSFGEHFGAFEGCQSRAPNTKTDPADSSCCS
ncbi:MAG: methyltransferase domain-containing protein [Planctomycetota bacterium]|jgi:2-polyprenyl-3-methyl-5-hydroxy-6-metoxy-1,4-benzoquinol methylase